MAEVIRLKGGFETIDPRLDRLPQFDARSKAYSIAPQVADRSLRSRSHPSRLWLDQGREGACVSFSLHHELGASPVPVAGLTDALAQLRYKDIQRIDEWPGEDYEGTSVLAGAKLLTSLGYYKEYRWAFNIDDALLALSHEGPQVWGVPWRDSMWQPDSRGLMDTSGKDIGGHAIMARGILLPRKFMSGQSRVDVTWLDGTKSRIETDVPLIRFRNSWGPSWGRRGEFVVRADAWEELAFKSGQGECMIPVGRQRPK